jgi:SNF2 family DNA or RNA helicase
VIISYSFRRPGVLGNSERIFEKKFVDPILAGMPSDACEEDVRESDAQLDVMKEKLQPYVQRRDASILLNDPPPMQQVVLHVRQTKLQARLYGAYKKLRKTGANNFLKTFNQLRPVHNHPGCLLVSHRASTPTEAAAKAAAESVAPLSLPDQPLKEKKDVKLTIKAECPKGDSSGVIDLISESESEQEEVDTKEAPGDTVEKMSDARIDEEWWGKVARREGLENLKNAENGIKIVLLFHILVHSSILDEKVVVFSQCLKVSQEWIVSRFPSPLSYPDPTLLPFHRLSPDT